MRFNPRKILSLVRLRIPVAVGILSDKKKPVGIGILPTKKERPGLFLSSLNPALTDCNNATHKATPISKITRKFCVGI